MPQLQDWIPDVKIDNNLPAGTAMFVDSSTGEVLGKIINIRTESNVDNKETICLFGKEHDVKLEPFRNSSTHVNKNPDMVRMSICMTNVDYMKLQTRAQRYEENRQIEDKAEAKVKKALALELLSKAAELLAKV